MPDKIEKILKEIHVLLSGSPAYEGSSTDVIVDKKQVFRLLEKLNYALLEIMDAYEVNELSKERAISKVQKDAQKIIDDASKNAEEIYAASLIYTDDALNELRDTMNKTKKNIVREYEAMFNKIDSQIDLISKNKDELHMQLADLSSGNEYLNIIIDEKKRREKERDRYNKVVDGETRDETESRLTIKAKEARENKSDVVVNVNTNHPAFKKNPPKPRDEGDRLLDGQLDLPPKKDGEYSASDFNLDDEYFKWQEDKDKSPISDDVDIKGTFLGKFFKSSDKKN